MNRLCAADPIVQRLPIENPETAMRRVLFSLLLLLTLHAARADALWQTLPPTPPPVAGEHTGHARVNGISLFYATVGQGPPVVLLHGGLANSDYWGHQVRALSPR